MSTTAPEHARRRTFAIISHPDAGKTTLTETLLLAGGAIRAAGEVAARGEARRTRSDWMKIERERGISVSASVMTFERGDTVFNLLDTPGHEDFSEDTYRTLTAADSAIMVLDAAKGIEPRTLKLFEICRLRDIPIITFVNKMDREARDPLELLDEVQSKLALDTSPLYWPAASGERFGGMLDLKADQFVPFVRPAAGDAWSFSFDRIDPAAADLSPSVREEMSEGAELARAAYPAFDMEAYRAGALTPVVFGSALRRFGVVQLLDAIESLAPSPRPQKGEDKAGVRLIGPDEAEVSGFVFKIQANMDPNHRDRIAFLRLCSGTFRRGMRLKTSGGKQMTVSAPMMFMAQDREIADTAFAGDVIGIPNHGALRVGDSLSETGQVRYSGVPNFAPEILRRVILKDPMKAKHMRRALESLAEEGVTQLFKPRLGSDMIVGAVGPLQFDVLVERIAAEYGLEAAFEPAPFQAARWVSAEDRAVLEAFGERHMASMAEDVDDAPVFLGKNAWEIGYVQEKNPGVRFTATRERLG
jgi:peptide chain release factor 3